MGEKRISDLFDVKTRYFRSTQLDRDFEDPTAFTGYVLTDFTRTCLERLAGGLQPGSGQRAWRMTGDYGSGKSSFALLLAHWFAGHNHAFPSRLWSSLEFHKFGVKNPNFVPLLVTCSREALGTSILKSLHRALVAKYDRGQKAPIAVGVQRLLDDDQEPTDERVLETIVEVNSRLIADGKGKGLMLIMDELGKFLEFASLHPQRQDIFLLQRLAETASRSGKEPLFVVCLLHQGFNAYADFLNQSAQREWEKVAGRFDEIIFNQPVEQIATLIGSALNVNRDLLPRSQEAALKQAMKQAVSLGWFGSAPVANLLDLAPSLYPLHPTVLPVLIRILRRFGQNERSLFSFLLSNEPFGLMAFAAKPLTEAEPYRLHHFYDYVRTNLGHRLAGQSYRSHWNLIESLVESFATENPEKVKVLKTVGILNLLDDNDLVSTEDAIVCALAGSDGDDQKTIRATLEKLRSGKRVLYDRGRARGLCLWPHTSVDLEKAYEEARRATVTTQRVASLIKDYLETRPIVARRHYIKTGNLRHYDVRYCSIQEMESVIGNTTTTSDGTIVIPLCETEDERDDALKLARHPELAARLNWLVAIPQPLSNLSGMVQEVQRWDWISTNILELNADKYAREEVTRQKADARLVLERRIQSIIGLKQSSGQMSLAWFHQTKPKKIKDGRQLLEELSTLCDDAYSNAPQIHNELVNRRSLSSAAAAARMRLIEQMFASPGVEALGMETGKTPPEMSMYLSVLRNTGLHQKHGDAWRIGEPHYKTDEKCRVLPTLRRIREIVRNEPESSVNIVALFEELRKPPYGVRDGLMPLLLTVFAIAHEQDVAFFKDGTFQRELTAEMMLVLTKAQERFDIQYCKIEGVRAELFEKLLAAMEIKPSGDRRPELLDVVKPLCVFVAQLPTYVQNTKKITPSALSVRDTILNAREPAKLLFTDLPRACGFEPFTPDAVPGKAAPLFVKTLKASLDELRAAFPELQDRLRKRLRQAFELPGSFQQFRSALASRAEQVVVGVSEPKLKAMCLRLLDDTLAETDWLESVGSHLALKPPSKWHDFEEDLFNQELAELAARFHRVESIVFSNDKPSKNGVAIRLAVTKADGVEHEQVIHFTIDEEQKLREIQTKFEDLLALDKRLGLAAASRAIWSNFEKRGKSK